MKTILILFLFFSLETQAAPVKLEVWFLSSPSAAQVHPLIHERPLKMNREILAMEQDETHQSCQLMGEEYFHPQFGLHVHTRAARPKTIPKEALYDYDQTETPEQKPAQHKYLTNYEEYTLSCDKDYHFDLYCGNAKPERNVAAKMPVEIWIDTSSSFRSIDFSPSDGLCHRQKFLDDISRICPTDKMDISLFDTSKKQIGSFSGACRAHGLNSVKRMKDWIDASKANYLLIITDISEYTVELEAMLGAYKAKLKGHQVGKPLFAHGLSELAPVVAKNCIK